MDGRTWIAGATISLAAACAGEDLSVGSLRCEGEGVRCARIAPTSVHSALWIDCEVPIGEPATVLWHAEVPCPDGHTCREMGSQLVVHEDDSTTLLRQIEAQPDDSNEEVQRGVLLRRFDADGVLLWENDELIATESSALVVPGVGGTAFGAMADAALATDADAGVLLAVMLGQLTERALEVHRVDAQGQLELLFRVPAPHRLNAIAALDDDVLIASHHESSPGESSLPELARYLRDGTLLWRQTALDQLSSVAGSSGISDPMPLVVDSRGRATFAVVDPAGINLVGVGPDGNLAWFSPNESQDVSLDCSSVHVAIDSQDRVIAGYGRYGVIRGDRLDSRDRARLETASRNRDEFWEPYALGVDRDRDDRVLAMTQTGTHDHPMLLLDRVSEDFSSCETFHVADAPELFGAGPPREESECLGVHGIRAADNGDVYFWSESTVGRIALP